MHRQSPSFRGLRAALAGAAGCLALLPRPLPAGDIVGTVRAEGAPAASSDEESGGGYASRRYKFLERVKYEDFSDFIVYVDQDVPPAPAPASPPPRARVTQRDGMFVPHVLPVAVGTTVEWPNEDTIFHNVFSISESTPFDLGVYKNGDRAREVTFGKVGRVDVFCSIHKKMSCIVLVLPSPWFARSDARGRYVIAGVPAGTYRVKAWHERLPPRTLEITVPADGEVALDFVLGFGGLPRP